MQYRLTPYTPYQEEIGQGRLECLLNFQTLIVDLTCMDVANASLLDEATSASEALAMTYRHNKRKRWFVADNVHPQTLSVIHTRASALGIEVQSGDPNQVDDFKSYSGVLLQYPDTYGYLSDYGEIVNKAHNDEVRVLYYKAVFPNLFVIVINKFKCWVGNPHLTFIFNK